jgi:Leucine-rich repeat (LRR) protein
LSKLPQLAKLNLSENFLNGVLSEYAGLLTQLEVLNLDINNLTALGPAVQNWRKLKVITISDNSLTGLCLTIW